MSPEKRIPAALLILRFFLAIFLLQWSIEKLFLPDAAARIARSFYGVTLPAEGSYALGMAELIVSLALLFGFYRTISYGLSLFIHTVTVVVSCERCRRLRLAHSRAANCALRSSVEPPSAIARRRP